MPLCLKLQQQAQCSNWDVNSVSGQYGSGAPRCELYALLLALVLVPCPRWPAPLSCAVCVFSQGRRDQNITVSGQHFESSVYCVSLYFGGVILLEVQLSDSFFPALFTSNHADIP